MNIKCPKCGGEMEEGFVADRSTSFNIAQSQYWGTGTSMLEMGKLKDQKIVTTYRCKSCGFLESYAK